MAEAPHIAIFLPSLGGGGAERVMTLLANGFAARGHRVDLVLVQAAGPYLKEVSPAVRVVALDRRRVIASLPALVRYLRSERPTAMVSALTHANIVAILSWKLARMKTRLVVSERNTPSGERPGITRTIFHVLTRRLYPLADRVIAVSRGIADELVRDFGLSEDRVVAIPNPLDIEAIRRLAADRPYHPWLAQGEPPVILAVGRLTPQKDFPTLLRAFARIRSSLPARLVVLGEGESRADLHALATSLGVADDVWFSGFQDNPYGWMANCAVYVLSSRWEGFPNSLGQAMVCGARIVSTDCRTGPDEILEGGKWGRLVPVGDVDAVAGAIAAVLKSKRSPKVERRAEYFRADRIIDRYLAELNV